MGVVSRMISEGKVSSLARVRRVQGGDLSRPRVKWGITPPHVLCVLSYTLVIARSGMSEVNASTRVELPFCVVDTRRCPYHIPIPPLGPGYHWSIGQGVRLGGKDMLETRKASIDMQERDELESRSTGL